MRPLFDSESLKRWRYLSLVARRLGGGILAGPRTRLPAGGTEPTGHRDYAPGDDLRHVDWNLCARHDELLVRQFQREADRPVYLLLDCSRSMALGSPSKFDVARQIVAVLAYVALAGLERASVVAFSDRVEADFPPLCDRTRILGLARFLERLAARREGTDLLAAAKAFGARRQRRGLAVLVSDLCDPAGFEQGLEVLRRSGYPPRVVHLYDPHEAEPDVLGDSELIDVETGACWQLTLTERQLSRYRRVHARFRDSVRDYCAGHRVPCVQVAINLPLDDLLLTAIGARK